MVAPANYANCDDACVGEVPIGRKRYSSAAGILSRFCSGEGTLDSIGFGVYCCEVSGCHRGTAERIHAHGWGDHSSYIGHHRAAIACFW